MMTNRLETFMLQFVAVGDDKKDSSLFTSSPLTPAG